MKKADSLFPLVSLALLRNQDNKLLVYVVVRLRSIAVMIGYFPLLMSGERVKSKRCTT